VKRKQLFRDPAEVTGIILLVVSTLVFAVDPLLAAAIALFYILLCVSACFFPQTNFLLPVISRGHTGKNMVALTFDDGPAEPTTEQILDLLDKYSVKATFFVSGINALRYPEIIKDIVSRGHSIGNHSLSHNPFLMLTSFNNLFREISGAQEILQKMGINTQAFRPPVGIVNPKLSPILDKLEMFCVTFSCRAFDAGNFHVKNIASKILKKVKADDIIMLHDVPPRRKEESVILLPEIERLLKGIIAKGLSIVPLADLIDKEVMSNSKNLQKKEINH
jgi:peptidoglycan/xylan/chitin deacetylase (PgdA/CDA1 family)